MRLALVAALAGCNQIFGVHETGALDGPVGPLRPPVGATTCTPVDFTTWTFAPHTVVGAAGVIHPTFTAADRVIFGYQGNLFESGLDGDPQELASLDRHDGAMLMNASAAPGGDVIWFLRFAVTGGGLLYATRDPNGWTAHTADLGQLGYGIQPGAAAFFDGTVRMVLGVQATSQISYHLEEVSSPDGATWAPLATIPWSASSQDFDPALSVDGCKLLFVRSETTTNLYVAHRAADGSFAPPLRIATSIAENLFQPALDPTKTRIWLNAEMTGLIEGKPP